jgi:hypothetical protein
MTPEFKIHGSINSHLLTLDRLRKSKIRGTITKNEYEKSKKEVLETAIAETYKLVEELIKLQQ